MAKYRVGKRVIIILGRIIIAAIIATSLLSIYIACFSFSGIHINNETKATDYKWEKGQRKAVSSEGFAWNKFDFNGFNNLEVLSEIDILLMGSSHMEAVNVAQDENVGYLLNALLNDKYTYNIGVSGHTIYHCVKNVANAVNYYHPQSYVVIETDRIELDVDEMKQVLEGVYPHIPSYDSGLLYALYSGPLVKTIPAKNYVNKVVCFTAT